MFLIVLVIFVNWVNVINGTEIPNTAYLCLKYLLLQLAILINYRYQNTCKCLFQRLSEHTKSISSEHNDPWAVSLDLKETTTWKGILRQYRCINKHLFV